MWNLGKRDIIVLVSVAIGCAFVFNYWGPFYAITVILMIIVCAWLIIVRASDTTFTLQPQSVLDQLQLVNCEINAIVHNLYLQASVQFTRLLDIAKRLYRTYIVEIMAQRRRSTYQLSEENYSNSGPSRLGLIAGLSPIVRRTVGSPAGGSNAENCPYGDSRILERSASMSKITSTPMVPWKREEVRNGDVYVSEHPEGIRSPWSRAGSSPNNHTLSRGEDVTYSTKGSPWGTSISPKMRDRAGGVKTVQTVAGPLLASTRYNIDPKVYADVTSPGLTSRLTKYATEANLKLTHQSQYATGQFPRVNLNASPTPMINSKTGKMRQPVTVRVAPPENTKYSPPERQKILSNICHAETKSAPNVVQVLKDISLKRHASREDVTFELAKKQRTESGYNINLECLEEMTQKRGRDDSSRSEEEISPRNKSLRPAKRTKMPSCHDILSSLSSSINVSSGTKRKAIDTSRSGTPDVGKHFKSLDTSLNDVAASASSSRSIVEQTKSNNKRSLNDFDASRNFEAGSPQKKWSEPVVTRTSQNPQIGKQILEIESNNRHDTSPRSTDAKMIRENYHGSSQTSVKLTDRLFMKAEPQNIDKLKMLIDEHKIIKPQFLTNETDEIKKSDIVNMRQTSMKTRLKSMFDAISGKASSSINPEVVIQAEEVKSTVASIPTASLNSSTSTTNVNTSPISAIVPIIGKTKDTTTPAKHVRFQFSTGESIPKMENNETKNIPIVESTKLSSNVDDSKQSINKIDNPNAVEKSGSTTTTPIFQNLNPSIATSVAQTPAPGFSFGSPMSNAANSTSATPKISNASSVATPITSIGLSSSSTIVTTISPPQFNSTQLFNVPTIPNQTSQNSPATITKSDPIVSSTSNTAAAESSAKITKSPIVNFSFGSQSTISTTPSTTQTGLFPSTSNQVFSAASPAATTASSSSPSSTLFGVPNKTPTTSTTFGTTATNNPSSSATAPATTAAFSFGATSQTTEKKAFTFGSSTGSTQNATTTGNTQTSQIVGTTSVATTSTGFSFSSVTPSPMTNASRFGEPATTSSAPTTSFPTTTSTPSLFSFGGNSAAAAAATPKPSSFAFSSSTTATPAATSTTAPIAMGFGSTSNTASPLFGVGSANPSTTTTTTGSQQQPSSLFGITSTSTSGFSNTTTATPLTFGTSTGQSSFAATTNTSTTFGPAKTMETPSFGTPTTNPPPSFAASTTSNNLFGGGVASNPSSTTPSTTAPPPAFGANRFGETKPPPPAFGSQATTSSSSFPATSGTSLFGSQSSGNTTFGAPPNSSNASSTPVFGNPNAPASSFGSSATAATTFGTPSTAPPAFGATNSTTTSFGSATTTATNFGTIGSSSAPSFGLQTSNPNTTGASNSGTSAFGGPTGFGAGATTTAAPPAFGTAVATTSGFGTPAATPSFGNPVNPPPAFSTTNTGFSGFGNSAPAPTPFGSQPSSGNLTFGATSATPAASTFGVTATANNAGSFTFGANQPNVQQPQQSASFAFGSATPAAGNNAPGTSAPFQFGNSAPQSGGFNFGGAPAAPALNFSRDGASGASFGAPAPGTNAFNAPATGGGMFSIGSGSTGPRSRPSRRRQR